MVRKLLLWVTTSCCLQTRLALLAVIFAALTGMGPLVITGVALVSTYFLLGSRTSRDAECSRKSSEKDTSTTPASQSAKQAPQNAPSQSVPDSSKASPTFDGAASKPSPAGTPTLTNVPQDAPPQSIPTSSEGSLALKGAAEGTQGPPASTTNDHGALEARPAEGLKKLQNILAPRLNVLRISLIIPFDFTNSLLCMTWTRGRAYMNSQSRQESINLAEHPNYLNSDMLLEACTRTLEADCLWQAEAFLTDLESNELVDKFIHKIWERLQDQYRLSSPVFLPQDIKGTYSALIKRAIPIRLNACGESPTADSPSWTSLRFAISYAHNLEEMPDDSMSHSGGQISGKGGRGAIKARLGLRSSDVIPRRDHYMRRMLHAHEPQHPKTVWR
ncbi:hypothetical protein DICSQDRAFT_130548 [Dichomitus squalens LYAD-421 SS1]|uniref:Uncharacterized protein n=1 Tax=Dichomitus squalens (strain LYAD-421) TaxID=732165 RepID=R7SKL7_DICSQ|nr:uncharacterized protein DICSQDRAFT_130548 [Dichomitus squalens LYAD-421 SS1]EJF55602.1 hypothetical protein DICSQDRAFT_130548 [Dichomitus squalens LYAD-421 SS1]